MRVVVVVHNLGIDLSAEGQRRKKMYITSSLFPSFKLLLGFLVSLRVFFGSRMLRGSQNLVLPCAHL